MIIGGKRERAPHYICSFSGSSSDRAACPFVCLTGWNIMGMCGERNTWLSCTVFVARAQDDAKHGGRRAREGTVRTARIRLERDRQPEGREGSKSASKESSEGNERRARRLES